MTIHSEIREEQSIELPQDKVVQSYLKHKTAPAPAASTQQYPAARSATINQQIKQRASELMAAHLQSMNQDNASENSNNDSNIELDGYSSISFPTALHKSSSFQLHCKYTPVQLQYVTSQRNPSQYTAVIDSGAGGDMTSHTSLFSSIEYFYHDTPTESTPKVIMGDDTTTHYIKGHGIMDYMCEGKRIIKYGFLVPNLGQVVLLSVNDHSKYKGCCFHSGNDGAVLAFPNFILQCATSPEIQVSIEPTLNKQLPIDFNFYTSIIYECLCLPNY